MARCLCLCLCILPSWRLRAETPHLCTPRPATCDQLGGGKQARTYEAHLGAKVVVAPLRRMVEEGSFRRLLRGRVPLGRRRLLCRECRFLRPDRRQVRLILGFWGLGFGSGVLGAGLGMGVLWERGEGSGVRRRRVTFVYSFFSWILWTSSSRCAILRS